MYLQLQYIIILIAACELLASCSTQDQPDDGRVEGREMTFVVSDPSRASVTTDINFPDSRFAIFGDMTFKDTAPTTIFNNTPVRYSDGKWVYDNTQYWFPGHMHTFIAIYPFNPATVSYSNSTVSFSYTLPDNYADTPDIMAATHRRMYGYDTSATPVKLTFFHILSRIDFKVTNVDAADIVRVDEIKFEGINRTGTFSITPAPLLSGSEQTEDCDYSWSGVSNSGNLTANMNVEIPETETRQLFPDDNAILMIPQTGNNSVIMHITYTLFDDDTSLGQVTLTAQTPIGGWEAGKAYTYSIDIEEITKELQLTVSVKPWHQPKDTGVKVPES